MNGYMDNTKYLLVFVNCKDAGMERIAVKMNGDEFEELDMDFFAENNNLRMHMKLSDNWKVIRIEELDGVLA
jgi:hypothetical protein